MTTRSLLVVNYRSASLALDAIRTAREASSLPLQVVVVDNSVDPSEAELLRSNADIVVAATRNLGYAGGINLGRPACSGEVIIISNPDVRFGSSAIDRLLEVDAAVAGPALYWDDGYDWMLPPAELHTMGEVVDRAIASRWRAWARGRDRRRFLARVAFWSHERTVDVSALSGAVMAIRADAFDRAGGFDERFALYFEENDFLRRVRGEIVYVPAARCRHLYNQSASGSAEAATFYAQSELLYLRKWGGAFAKRFEKRRSDSQVRRLSDSSSVERRTGESDLRFDARAIVIEASPLASFETSAGHFTDQVYADVPDDIWRAYRQDALYLRAVDRRTGRVLRSWAKARIPV